MFGRKGYLFCQNDDSAESTAIIYSLMGCCKSAGVSFINWMVYFLNHVHEQQEIRIRTYKRKNPVSNLYLKQD